MSSYLRQRIRETIRARDGPNCWVCDEYIEPGDMTIEHLIPRSRGGTDHPVNCRISHKPCNKDKGDELPDAEVIEKIVEEEEEKAPAKAWAEAGLDKDLARQNFSPVIVTSEVEIRA